MQTVTLAGQRFVAEYKRLAGKTSKSLLPRPDAEGNYPAIETIHTPCWPERLFAGSLPPGVATVEERGIG